MQKQKRKTECEAIPESFFRLGVEEEDKVQSPFKDSLRPNLPMANQQSPPAEVSSFQNDIPSHSQGTEQQMTQVVGEEDSQMAFFDETFKKLDVSFQEKQDVGQVSGHTLKKVPRFNEANQLPTRSQFTQEPKSLRESGVQWICHNESVFPIEKSLKGIYLDKYVTITKIEGEAIHLGLNKEFYYEIRAAWQEYVHNTQNERVQQAHLVGSLQTNYKQYKQNFHRAESQNEKLSQKYHEMTNNFAKAVVDINARADSRLSVDMDRADRQSERTSKILQQQLTTSNQRNDSLTKDILALQDQLAVSRQQLHLSIVVSVLMFVAILALITIHMLK